MKYAILSDVHANLTALDSVLADAEAAGVERIVCLGDVVGYGPQPAEAVARVRAACFTTLAGNHDDAVSERGDASAFVDLAKDAVERHRSALSSSDLDWLRSLPYFCMLDGGALAVHGDVCDPSKFYYVNDESDAKANFAATDAQLVFVGHTHEPGIFLTGQSSVVYKIEPQDFVLEEGKRYIVNPGTVGYPREADGKCFSSYVLYDSTEQTVRFRSLPFQVSSVMQRGRGSKSAVVRRLVAAAALLAALAAGVAVWMLTPKTAATVVATRELSLDPDCYAVRANIELAHRSDPVQLRIVFESASGEVVDVVSQTVKKSWKKGVRRPAGSVRARFSALKTKNEDKITILKFAPSPDDKAERSK